ncbi:hypothetical protein V6N13_111541 [Hibiscus sabdariffa]|uniref:BHLH domain-containing protein n=1 Tax=Hibiscus sabdariffa TaxID=183260 RepID=A0ABR2TKL9_9ROSI
MVGTLALQKITSTVISQQFYDVKPKDEVGNYWDGNMGYKEQYRSNKSGQVSRSRTPLHAQHHVITERKRREKLNHSFISLSALIPGLKQASVLGDGTRDGVIFGGRNVLEKQVANKIMELVIFVKKIQIYADDENFDGNAFLEIEARVSDKDVLIDPLQEQRVHIEHH